MCCSILQPIFYRHDPSHTEPKLCVYAVSKTYIASDISVALSKRFMRTQGSALLECIKVQNFKRFQSLDISLNKFNVIIRAGASGKSNFAQVFKFLNDIKVHSLDGAISRHGGMECLLNFAEPDCTLVRNNI